MARERILIVEENETHLLLMRDGLGRGHE